ncbi:MAG: PP2C family serine/threonine-protein phosphatase, partial [Ferruginibacter sp.]
KNPQNEKMACVVTLAVVDVENNTLYYAHIGDTRLYLFRDGSLIKLTRDHSPVGFLEESGRLSESAAMMHPKRNEVNKALGFETNLPFSKDFIDTGGSPFLPGDTILICSDGLTDMIPASKIISILQGNNDLAVKANQLVNAANDAGGSDNITTVLVFNDKSPSQQTATKPLVTLKKNNDDAKEAVMLAPDTHGENMPELKKQRTGNFTRLLLLFCIIFFLGFVWLLIKNYTANKDAEQQVAVLVPKHRNEQELNFSDSINASSKAIVKLTGMQTILISDTLIIKSDSLHLIGNGTTFIRDSAYTGPALILASNCKYILLDSMTFENFKVGVLVTGKGLHLKNIRFKNCIVPLQFEQHFIKDTLVNGAQAEPVFRYMDTLHK